MLEREEVPALDPIRYGLSQGKSYPINGIIWNSGESTEEIWPLDRIVQHMRQIYVGRIAYEYMHSVSKTERLWFSHLLESESNDRPDTKQKRRIWELVTKSEVFDQFLQLKFPNLKRYGLEGGESMIPAIDTLFQVASEGMHLILVSRRFKTICFRRNRACHCSHASQGTSQP